MLLNGVGKRVTAGDVIANLQDQILHHRVVHAVSNDFERLHQRHTGFHHGRELARKERNVSGRDLGAHRSEVEATAFLGDLGRVDTLFAKLGLGNVGVGTGDLTFGLAPRLVGSFIGEDVICSSHCFPLYVLRR